MNKRKREKKEEAWNVRKSKPTGGHTSNKERIKF